VNYVDKNQVDEELDV